MPVLNHCSQMVFKPVCGVPWDVITVQVLLSLRNMHMHYKVTQNDVYKVTQMVRLIVHYDATLMLNSGF